MITSHPPQPPHLLHDMMYPTGSPAVPTTAPGRGIKGLFSRRAISPEPVPMSARSKLRGLADKPGQPSRARTAAPDGQKLVGHAEAGMRRATRSRPSSPDQAGERNIRFALSELPAMQRGDDGKWQQPSLSKGSSSTSALAAYAEVEETPRSVTPIGDERQVKRKKTHKHSLSLLFHGARFGAKSPVEGMKRKASGDMKQVPVGAVSTSQPAIRPSHETIFKPLPQAPRPVTPENRITGELRTSHNAHSSPGSPSHLTPSKRSAVPESEALQQHSYHRPSMLPRTSKTPPTTPRLAHSKQQFSPYASPDLHAKRNDMLLPASPSQGASSLSREHYLLRLSTSVLVKYLTPVIRGSSFVTNDKNMEMKGIADDRLSALSRMEKSWSSDWAKAAALVGSSGEQTEDGAESRIRNVAVGERTKSRERKVWVDAIKDGILLCFLLNHLFPSQPSHITRVNISEDGILRATNITRFITACQAIGLPDPDIFNLHDLAKASEASLGRVAWTLVALGRLASQVGRSPSRSPAAPRPGSRPPSRATSTPGSPSSSPPASPRRLSAQPTNIARRQFHEMIARQSSRDSAINLVSPTAMDRSRSADSSNDLHTKLQVVTSLKTPEADDPAFRTPTTSTFGPDISLPGKEGSGSSSGSLIRPSPMRRASTQPNMSPSIRPKSPSSAGSPSRATTPIGKASQGGVRPTLRPRYTTGSKTQVSFADAPDSPRSNRTSGNSLVFAAHSQERTPSLISSGSRITSGYTRSSVATVTGEDHSTAIDFAEDEDEDDALMRRRERRMSEKALHDARAKFFGAALSTDDLPGSLQIMAMAEDDQRGMAISQSLATLEGARPMRPDSSPRHRHSVRRQEVTKVIEEDEMSSSSISEEGIKPPVSRRLSLNGKVYAAKRSLSPPPRPVTPTGRVQPFPLGPRGAPLATSQSVSEYLPRPGNKLDRPQSEQYPSARSEEVSKPMNMRNQSMVNLSSSAGPPSIFRDNSSSSILKASQPLQVLEFREPGLPPVRYQLGNCIGRGQFGSVYRSLNLSTGQMVAIKRIRLHGMEEAEVRDVMREVDLLKRLAHPSIVKYEGMSRDEEYLNIVLEFVENGSLGQTLKAFGNFNEKLVSSYVTKILEGLDYLHSQGVVHCDLKAANILSTKNGNVKLSDFGVSLNMKAVENIRQDATQGKTTSRDVAGTPNWMAPEVISLNGASPASDIWSLGCTIIELLTGKPPYAEITNSMSVLFRIVEDEMPPLPDVSPELEDFLKLCFIKDPKHRPEAVVLFEHPWVKALNPEIALRPQDSVPFLRRVSIDLRRVDSSRLFADQATSPDGGRRTRNSNASSHGRQCSDGSQKGHQLVKTTFSKAIICRICHTSLKKAGVLCQSCGLLCHTACAARAGPRCDINEQIALLARQQDLLQPATPSRPPSRQGSFERGETSLAALPGKLLHQWKRSRSTLHVDSVNAESQGLRRSASNASQRPYGHERPSLDTRASHGSRHSTSESDSRRQSMVRFELDETSKSTSGQDQDKDENPMFLAEDSKSLSQDTDVRIGVSVEHSSGQREEKRVRHVRGKESKSDCIVQ